MTKITAFLRDDAGAAAAEYVLILAIIGSAIAASAFAFGESIAAALDRAALMMAGYP